jgi:mitochondrial nucleoid factor 1
LDEIASDSALKKYPRKLTSSSTGLSAAECKEIVSTNFLKYLNQEEKKGFFKSQK